MTRIELAAHIRTTGNGFLEPIEDGTDMTQKEITLLQALAHSATALALRIERDAESDQMAKAWNYKNESCVYAD